MRLYQLSCFQNGGLSKLDSMLNLTGIGFDQGCFKLEIFSMCHILFVK